MYAAVHVYTEQVTFSQVPEKHGHVKLVTLYTKVRHATAYLKTRQQDTTFYHIGVPLKSSMRQTYSYWWLVTVTRCSKEAGQFSDRWKRTLISRMRSILYCFTDS